MFTVTEKLYYQDSQMRRATGRVLKVDGNEVVLDRTIFFPEGGGQVGDRGTLSYGDRLLEVVGTRKRGGQTVLRAGLPVVNVETEVIHVLGNDVDDLRGGEIVELAIDSQHRDGCAVHHTATHLVMGAIWERFGRDSFVTKGCSIQPNEARIDMFTEQQFTGGLLREIEARVNEYIGSDAAVEMQPVPGVPEVFIWHCGLNEFLRQPCGGTHVSRLGLLAPVRLQRQGKGKNLERVYIRTSIGGNEVGQ